MLPVIELRRVNWSGHSSCTEKMAHTFRSSVRVSQRDHKEIGWEHLVWIRLVQDGVQWPAFVNTLTNL
jgi:hypothetical protein